jgi:uncharacterized damage-inducible protein DinB
MAKKVRRSSSRGKTVKKPGKARSPKPAPAPKKRAKRASAGAASATPNVPFAVIRESVIGSLLWSHGTMDMVMTGFPEDKATYQSHAHDNHLLWTLGHMAATYAWLVGMFEGKIDLPDGYMTLFGYGSKPSADASQYPSFNEVRRVYNDAFDQLMSAIKSQSDADLMKPPFSSEGKDNSWFGKTRLEVLIRINHHEGWHHGQLSTLRRALGLKSMY